MSSTNPWPLSGIEATSADLIEPVRERLLWWCERPRDHARFLNTLALLEHIGSRKIMVSQTRGPLGEAVLKHLAEETRHAYFFKRAAEKVAGKALDFSERDTIAPASARMYFGRLDASIAHDLGSDVPVEVPYLYVSMTVELRAIWMYRLYHRVLAERPVGLSLKSVLAEEELHLTQMANRLDELDADPASRVPEFAGLENKMFRHFWAALDSSATHQRLGAA